MKSSAMRDEVMPDVVSDGQMTIIINRLQSLANEVGDMRGQVENIGDRMFGAEPTIDVSSTGEDKMSGDIDQIGQCLDFLARRLDGLSSQIRRLETL